MRLRLSPEAKLDIYQMHEFGSLAFGASQADRYLDDLTLVLVQIEQFPMGQRERPEVEPPLRIWPCSAHHVCYRIVDSEVWVVRILHHSMDWTNEL